MGSDIARRRPKREYETAEVAAMTMRMIAAVGRRSGDDVEGLADLAEILACAERVTGDAVRECHAYGYSWAEIGARFGVTRQAAQQRWGASAR